MMQNSINTKRKINEFKKTEQEIHFVFYPEIISKNLNLPTELYVEHTLDIKTGNLKIKTYDKHQYFNSNVHSRNFGRKKSKPKWIDHGIVINLKEKYPELFTILLQEEKTRIDETDDETDETVSKLQKFFFKEINDKLKYPLFDRNLKPGQKDIWTKGSEEELLQDLTYLINQDQNAKSCQEWPVVIKINYESLKHKKLLYKVFNPSNLQLSSKTQEKIENALKKYAFKGHFYHRGQHYSQRDYDFRKIPNTTYLEIRQQTPHEMLDAKIKGKLL